MSSQLILCFLILLYAISTCNPRKLYALNGCPYLKAQSCFFEWFLSELYFYFKINTTMSKISLEYIWFIFVYFLFYYVSYKLYIDVQS